LATVFDQPTAAVSGGLITAEANSPSAALLATWLEITLNTTVEITTSDSPGIHSVVVTTSAGEISITRAAGNTATLSHTGSPDALISLPRRDLTTLLNEELRRLDPDEVYGWVIRSYAGMST
jgi:glucose-6-phosphate dehydrogenase assembly protein OpcA